jgi:hypothetical protein
MNLDFGAALGETVEGNQGVGGVEADSDNIHYREIVHYEVITLEEAAGKSQ